MSRSIFGWDLPPGCRLSDIPGNRPEDEKWEAIEEGFWNGKHVTDEIYSKFEKVKLDSELIDIVMKAIEYGIDLGYKEAQENAKEDKYYESQYHAEVRNPRLRAFFKSQRKLIYQLKYERYL